MLFRTGMANIIEERAYSSCFAGKVDTGGPSADSHEAVHLVIANFLFQHGVFKGRGHQ